MPATQIILALRPLNGLFIVYVAQDDREAMLSYSFKVSLSLIQNRKFRRIVHESLVKLYNELGVPDLISICQVFPIVISKFAMYV